MSLLFLFGAVICEVVGTLSLRMASEGRKVYYAMLIVFYPLSFFMLVQALGHGMGIGVAYGIWAALGVALTAIASRVLFAERITRMMAVGMGLIAAGVLFIELGAQ